MKLFRVEPPSNNRANNRVNNNRSTLDVKLKHRHRRRVSSNKQVPGVKPRLRLRRPGVNNNKYNSKLPTVGVVEVLFCLFCLMNWIVFIDPRSFFCFDLAGIYLRK